ncbi:MAG: NAD-dependent epimerase/dehydratase family protein, partial [Candidatus Adiutrix sp.]
MKILLTGALGFLGRRVLDFLLKEGHTVRALVRRNAPDIEALGVETVKGDLRNLDDCRQAAKGVCGIIHCAAKSGVWGPLHEYIEANLMTTTNLLNAARSFGVKWFVHTSSPSVVHTGQPLNGIDETAPYTQNTSLGYPYSKMLAERLVLAANCQDFRTLALRPHLIWGPKDPHFLPRLVQKARGGKLWLIKTHALIDGVYIDNAAYAHVLAAAKIAETTFGQSGDPSGKSYFIAQGEPLTAHELITLILKALSVSGENLSVRGLISPGLGYALAWAFETIWAGLKLKGEPPLTRFVAEELAVAHWFKLDEAKLFLGYEPKISLAEGLRLLAACQVLGERDKACAE